jgi:L-ribulokinase
MLDTIQNVSDAGVSFMNSSEGYTIGVDFGTLSGRAVVVRVSDGTELGSAVFDYPHAVMDDTLSASGAKLPPEWALQDPQDYLEVFKHTIPEAIQNSGIDARDVIGIGIDFTACTVLPIKADGTPLCFLEEHRNNPHAYVKLWKHHAAQPHADRINALAKTRNETWMPRYGGKISSEWMLAKALQILEEAPEVYSAADRILEAADWVIWQLSGVETCNTCTAGYKANFQDGQYPSSEFLGALNPGFANFAKDKLSSKLDALGVRVGGLSAQASAWTGLPEGIAVAVANVDAHVAVPAANAVQPGQMVLIMGTSTCHIMNGETLAEVPGMCGVVDGGVSPGMFGYEAGQSGVGDIFGWFVKNGVPPEYHNAARESGRDIHAYLTSLAETQSPGEHGLIALDWWNGNRSVLVDTELSGMMIGMTLATRAPDIYRALIESTAFGTRTIIEAFETSGVPVKELVIAGGLIKNKMLLQIYADVTGRELSVAASSQGPALGSAIHAAVAAGAYPDIYAAANVMGKSIKSAYKPNLEHSRIYDALYAEYKILHDYFGRGANDAMKRLKTIRNQSKK